MDRVYLFSFPHGETQMYLLSFLFGEPDEAGEICLSFLLGEPDRVDVIPVGEPDKLMSFLFGEPDRVGVIPISGIGRSWRHSCFWNRTKLMSFLFLESDKVDVIPVSGTGQT